MSWFARIHAFRAFALIALMGGCSFPFAASMPASPKDSLQIQIIDASRGFLQTLTQDRRDTLHIPFGAQVSVISEFVDPESDAFTLTPIYAPSFLQESLLTPNRYKVQWTPASEIADSILILSTESHGQKDTLCIQYKVLANFAPQFSSGTLIAKNISESLFRSIIINPSLTKVPSGAELRLTLSFIDLEEDAFTISPVKPPAGTTWATLPGEIQLIIPNPSPQDTVLTILVQDAKQAQSSIQFHLQYTSSLTTGVHQSQRSSQSLVSWHPPLFDLQGRRQ